MMDDGFVKGCSDYHIKIVQARAKSQACLDFFAERSLILFKDRVQTDWMSIGPSRLTSDILQVERMEVKALARPLYIERETAEKTPN